MSLHDAVAGYIEAVTAGQFDMPRRKITDDLRALLDQHPYAPSSALPVAAATEYAILSFRDGLDPVGSLVEAEERMKVLWLKPGRARIVHRTAWATEWEPLDPSADGPSLAAA